MSIVCCPERIFGLACLSDTDEADSASILSPKEDMFACNHAPFTTSEASLTGENCTTQAQGTTYMPAEGDAPLFRYRCWCLVLNFIQARYPVKAILLRVFQVLGSSIHQRFMHLLRDSKARSPNSHRAKRQGCYRQDRSFLTRFPATEGTIGTLLHHFMYMHR
jgi:hypothetical protein